MIKMDPERAEAYNKYRREWNNYYNYHSEWGNYKSDKYKSRSTLREEIRDILSHGTFSKVDLIIVKNMAKQLGFKGFV